MKLPKQVREEPNPPSRRACRGDPRRARREVAAAVRHGRAGRAPARRGGRRCAGQDVDAAGLRLRLPRSATKRDKCTLGVSARVADARRSRRRVRSRIAFPSGGCSRGSPRRSAYQAMTRACRNAKVPHYHPHDLRHRRITIWHQSGVPARELAERAGHARPSMSLDVYSPRHAAGRDRVRAVSGAYRRLDRLCGVVPVWSGRRTEAANPHDHTNVVLVRIILHRAESSRSLRGQVRRVWELESDGYAAWLRVGFRLVRTTR